MFTQDENTCKILSSLGIGALLGVIGMTLWNHRKQRIRNKNRRRPWSKNAKLYHTPAFCSSRCVWLLDELGVRDHVDIQPYNPYTATESEKEWYKKNVNSTGKVPSMVADDKTMTESGAICAYLAAAYDAFLPSQDKENVYYNWIFHSVVVLDPLIKTLYRQLQMTPSDQQDAEVITSSLNEYAIFANKLNDLLATNDYICGKELTAADIVLGYDVLWVSAIKGGILLQDYTNIKDYLARLKSRPAFQTGMGTMREFLNTVQWEPSTTE